MRKEIVFSMRCKHYLLIGALTSKPYAFTARSWELRNIETIDIFDSLCSNIRIDIRNSEILRILPITNQYLNEEWISDKTRYSYDSLKRWRFINPMIKKESIYINTSWQEIFYFLKNKIQQKKFQSIIVNTGNYCDLETLTALDTFCIQSNNVVINSDLKINTDKQNYFLKLKDIYKISGYKIFILIGTNLRLQNPILNIKFKKLSQTQTILISFIGSKYDYNFDLIYIGNNILTLFNIFQGKHLFINTIISFFKKQNVEYSFINAISVIFGEESIVQKKFYTLLSNIENFNFNFFRFDFITLNNTSGKLNNLELGFFNNKQHYFLNKNSKLIYLIDTDSCKYITKNDFVIFQGHHNDKIRTKFDVILPSVNWTEKSSLYLNVFGVIQKSNFIIYPPINSRIDWKIVRILSILFNKDIKFDNIKSIHERLNQLSPLITKTISQYFIDVKYPLKLTKKYQQKTLINLNTFKSYLPYYYNLNSLERSSLIINNMKKYIKFTNK